MRIQGSEQGDVDDSLLRPTEPSGPSAARPYLVSLPRWLSRRLRPTFLSTSLYLPEHASTPSGNDRYRGPACITLPRTPEVLPKRDPIEQHVSFLDNRSKSRQNRRRRNLCIIWSTLVTSIVALAYALDVDSSWRKVEDQWAVVRPLEFISRP